MAAKSLLFALVVVCACSGLNAWPWRKTTTTTAAPPRIPTPEQFLAQVQAARDAVGTEVTKSQQLLKEARDAEIKSKAITKASAELASWKAQRSAAVVAAAAKYQQQGVQVDHCVLAYNEDMANILRYLTKKANQMIESDFQDVETTATGKAMEIVNAMDALLVRANEEAASPSYGANVEAILDEAAKKQNLAKWGNEHIPAVLHTLTFEADTARTVYLGTSDANTVGSYAGFCMEQAVRNLEQ